MGPAAEGFYPSYAQIIDLELRRSREVKKAHANILPFVTIAFLKGDFLKGDVALQVLFPDGKGPGVQREPSADGRAAFAKTWPRVPPKADSSWLFGCGQACGESKAFDSPCTVHFDRKARPVVEGLYGLYTCC